MGPPKRERDKYRGLARSDFFVAVMVTDSSLDQNESCKVITILAVKVEAVSVQLASNILSPRQCPAGIHHPFQSMSSWYPPSFSVSVQLVSPILFCQCPAGISTIISSHYPDSIHHPFQSVSSWYPPSFSVSVQLVSTILFR